MRILLSLIISMSLSSCNLSEKKEKLKESYLSQYDLSRPDRKISLPGSLEEISGLGWYDGNTLACVNDEDGKLYLLDVKQGKVLKKLKFGKSGDYEGIEVVDGKIYCIKSNGGLTVFAINDEDKVVEKEVYELPFSTKNDIEGLGYDPVMHRLLIVPKERSDIKSLKIDGKAVYGFDLKKKQFMTNTVLVISSSEVKDKLGEKNFHASGIAYHPIDKQYYLIASAGKKIIKVDQKGAILEHESIDPDVLKQPEGIAFAANGDLYISSEGKGGKGYVLAYKMLRDK